MFAVPTSMPAAKILSGFHPLFNPYTLRSVKYACSEACLEAIVEGRRFVYVDYLSN